MSVNNFSPPLILLDLHVLQNFSNNEEKVQIYEVKSKKISNDQELIQSDPISCPQNQKGNN